MLAMQLDRHVAGRHCTAPSSKCLASVLRCANRDGRRAFAVSPCTQVLIKHKIWHVPSDASTHHTCSHSMRHTEQQ